MWNIECIFYYNLLSITGDGATNGDWDVHMSSHATYIATYRNANYHHPNSKQSKKYHT